MLTSLLLMSMARAYSQQLNGEEYVCLPCGSDCDNAIYGKPGACPHCSMQLVKKSTVVFKTIQPEKLCSYIASHPAVILLDVRTKKEFEERSFPNYGSLKNSINIPIQELEKRIAELDAYKSKEIIVVCSHSGRSPRASYMLTQYGFMHVTNLAGGLSELEDDSCKK
jgi:rhodanese-related sulfurtransferase/DNA-directed RNA polymerase subunit RPC12/RpoP